MSIKSELSVLKVNIQNAKDKLYTNLLDKGVTDITTASTLDAMADSVSDIVTGTSSGGGNLFEAIGYEATPKYIQDAIDYSQTIYDNWDANVKSTSYKYNGNKQLVFFPLVDTSNVTSMNGMFLDCTSLINVPLLNTSNVKYMQEMFRGATAINYLDLSKWDFSKVVGFCDNNNTNGGMFSECSNLRTLILPDVFCTSNITNLRYMFSNCKSLQSVDLSSWNTSNVTNMSYLFLQCSELTSINLNGWNTSNVNDMTDMFYYCSSILSIDLSSFDTSKVTKMRRMFSQCSGLTELDLTSFDTSNVNDMSSMLESCGNLTKVDGYISFKSYSSSTMSYSYFFGYSSNKSLRKITFKDIGYHTNAKQFNMSYATNWGVNSDTITDARQSLVDSLITYSFDRATNGYSTCTVTLAADTKAVLTSDEIAAITAKGFTIA